MLKCVIILYPWAIVVFVCTCRTPRSRYSVLRERGLVIQLIRFVSISGTNWFVSSNDDKPVRPKRYAKTHTRTRAHMHTHTHIYSAEFNKTEKTKWRVVTLCVD